MFINIVYIFTQFTIEITRLIYFTASVSALIDVEICPVMKRFILVAHCHRNGAGAAQILGRGSLVKTDSRLKISKPEPGILKD